MQRLLPPKLVAILMAMMVAGVFVAPWPSLPWFARIPGALVLGAGLMLTMRHATLFDRLGTNIKTFDDPDTLVRAGAFEWTRNPMYLGFTLMLIGVAVLLGAAIALVGPLAFVIAADRWYIPFEEQRMSATFGPDYDAYRATVSRWFGRKATA